MPFIGRATVSNPKPTKIYMHKTGYAEAFGDKAFGHNRGVDYVLGILRENSVFFNRADFLIAALWGERGEKIAEMFGYGDIEQWPGNPTVYSWAFKNGVYQPWERQISCGETLVVLGAEERLRREHVNLEDYMWTSPELGEDILMHSV